MVGRIILLTLPLVALMGLQPRLVAQVTEPQRRFEFTVFGQPAPGVDIVYQFAPGQVAPLAFTPYRRSATYSYAGPSLVRFARRTPVSNAVGNPEGTYTSVGEVEVPADIKRPLFMFFPDGQNVGRFQVVVVEDDAVGFPFGSVGIMNRSGFDLRGLVDDRVTALANGAQAHFPPASSADIKFALLFQDRLVPSFEQKLVVERNERTLLILLPPQRSSSPLVRWVLLTEAATPGDDSDER